MIIGLLWAIVFELAFIIYIRMKQDMEDDDENSTPNWK